MFVIIDFRKQLCIMITLKTPTSMHSVACVYNNHRYRTSHEVKCLVIRLLSRDKRNTVQLYEQAFMSTLFLSDI